MAFLDADDTWEPGFLAEMVAAFRRHPEVGAMASAYWLACSGRTRMWPPAERRPDEGMVENFFPSYIASRFCATSAVMVERELLLRLGGFRDDLWIGEDVELWCRIGMAGVWGFLPEPLATYCDDSPGSLTQGSTRVSRSADLWIWERDLLPMMSVSDRASYAALRWQMLKTQLALFLQARRFARFRAHVGHYKKELDGRRAQLMSCLAILPQPVLRILAAAYVWILKRRRAANRAPRT